MKTAAHILQMTGFLGFRLEDAHDMPSSRACQPDDLGKSATVTQASARQIWAAVMITHYWPARRMMDVLAGSSAQCPAEGSAVKNHEGIRAVCMQD